LQPLQNWIDVVCSGIDPKEVTLVVINGGLISALECKIAAALGATVGIVEGSGREASRLLTDPDWSETPNLHVLPADATTIHSFIVDTGERRGPLDETVRELLGSIVHGYYVEIQRASSPPDESAWERQPETFRESSRRQADDMFHKMHRIGYAVRKPDGGPPELIEFDSDEVELLAEMEHGRWTADRIRDGWSLGEKDADAKRSPYLVPWEELPEDIAEYDRVFVRKIPSLMAKLGYEIVRPERSD
jgi:hypothetical protein